MSEGGGNVNAEVTAQEPGPVAKIKAAYVEPIQKTHLEKLKENVSGGQKDSNRPTERRMPHYKPDLVADRYAKKVEAYQRNTPKKSVIIRGRSYDEDNRVLIGENPRVVPAEKVKAHRPPPPPADVPTEKPQYPEPTDINTFKEAKEKSA